MLNNFLNMKKTFLTGFIITLFYFVGSGQESKTTAKSVAPITSKVVTKPITITTKSGLQYTITSKGSGALAHKGDNVKVHYTGKFLNDSVFDSSVNRGTPFEFPLGRGRVIKGWDEGISYLHVGDKATFIIPASLAYGENGAGTAIPPNSTLKFDVELLGATPGVTFYDLKKKDTLRTSDGIKYLIVKAANSKLEKPPVDARVTVNYVMYLKDQTIIDATADRGKPFTFLMGKNPNSKGLEEAISLLHKGEKARIIIPYKLAYGEEGFHGIIPPKADIYYDLELIDFSLPTKPVPYDIANKKVDTTESGLKYIVVSKGNGERAIAGKTVKVHYTGYLDNGKMFDSSIERGEPIEFPLGVGQVIKGWEEGIALMNVGDKIRLIIPYDMGYGVEGRPPLIPPRSQLTFDVELIEVK